MSINTQGRLYFDITDIVDYAHGHDRVSGIQRVVLNVICNIAERYGNEKVRCLFYHRKSKSLLDCDPLVFSGESEFDAERLLYRLGLLRNWPVFPSRMRMKAHLQPLRESGKGLLRILRKGEIYLASLLWPSRLERFGLQRICDRFRGEQRLSLRRFAGLGAGDSLVMLGANWECRAIFELAERHLQANGDVVRMVYDLIPNLFPSYFPPEHTAAFNSWLQDATRATSRYICISKSTARDLHDYLQKAKVSAQVVAVPLAHEISRFPRNFRTATVTRRLEPLLAAQFVLCVGTIEIRKNHVALLRAWSRLHAELGDAVPKLVIAGRKGWLTAEFDSLLAGDKTLQGLVHLVDSPSDDELASLYGRCRFTVFPSVYEGWGLPVGESAWLGKYCIASNAASIPEVCGDLVDYFAPNDLEEFLTKLRRAILDKDYVSVREAAILQAPLRTWNDVARDIGAYVSANDA